MYLLTLISYKTAKRNTWAYSRNDQNFKHNKYRTKKRKIRDAYRIIFNNSY